MQPNNPPENSGWTFQPEGGDTARADYPAPPIADNQQVSATWTASEFIAHHKSPGWYLALVLGFVVLAIPVYFFTKDIISIVSISIVFILFLVISGNKPRQRSYTVDNEGISVDDKFYPYDLFKSFTISQEGAIGCINLMPLKRFMPEMAIYFAPDDEDRIVNVLLSNLPEEQLNEKITDQLFKRIRF